MFSIYDVFALVAVVTLMVFSVNIRCMSSREMTSIFGNQYVTKDVVNVCAGADFHPTCGLNEVIVIQNASYGRMEQGECAQMDMGHIGCKADVLHILQRRCSGRRHCTVPVPTKELLRTRPCYELESYLGVQYSCIKVISTKEYRCSSQNILRVTSPQGVISSLRPTTDCDSPNTVWLIEAKAGQRINVTLIDFSHVSKRADDLSNRDHVTCMTYVRDVTSEEEVALCGGGQLTRHVMYSTGNAVEVVVDHLMDDVSSQFLLQYQMLGCPDPPIDTNSWLEHRGDTVTVGCLQSQLTYKLKCVGTHWQGTYQNCTDTGGSDKTSGEQENQLTLDTLPRSLVITAVLAIALVVGTTIVVVGIFAVKRQRRDLNGHCEYTPHNIDSMPHSRHHTQEKVNPASYWIHQQPSHHTTHHSPGQGHSRETPTLQQCYQYTDTPTSGSPLVTSDRRQEYTHIWNRPLPATESQHSC